MTNDSNAKANAIYVFNPLGIEQISGTKSLTYIFETYKKQPKWFHKSTLIQTKSSILRNLNIRVFGTVVNGVLSLAKAN